MATGLIAGPNTGNSATLTLKRFSATMPPIMMKNSRAQRFTSFRFFNDREAAASARIPGVGRRNP